MMFSALLALALAAVVGLVAWETWADLCDARRTIDRMQARADQQDYVIAELRRRLYELKGEDN